MNIITKTRLLVKTRSAWNRIQKILKENNMQIFNPRVLLLVIPLLLAYITDVSQMLPATWQNWLNMAAITLTAIRGILNLFVNPDGTNAKTPWDPPRG